MPAPRIVMTCRALWNHDLVRFSADTDKIDTGSKVVGSGWYSRRCMYQSMIRRKNAVPFDSDFVRIVAYVVNSGQRLYSESLLDILGL